MKRFKPIVIDSKSLNRAADEVMKRRGTYFEPPLVRWHRLMREAREKVSNNQIKT
jgi:hypothetical protein